MNNIEQYVESKNLNNLKLKYPNCLGFNKYMNYSRYINGRIKLCKDIGLTNGIKRSILDISSGFGYFPLVCRFMGHRVKLTDIPNNLFDDVTDLFELEKKYMDIPTTGKIIIPFNIKFDIISAFSVVPMSYFNNDSWLLFLNICFNQINKNGFILLSPNRGGINKLNLFLDTRIGKSLFIKETCSNKNTTIVRKNES